MSGGAYDYVHNRINDIRLMNTDTDSRRAAFQRLLRLIGKAMHDIEWVDSGDTSDGAEHAAIDAVFDFLSATPETIKKAAAYDTLKEQLKEFLK